MSRLEFKRQRVVRSLVAIRESLAVNRRYHGPSDRERLRRIFAEKSVELVELEISAYERGNQ